MRIEDKNLIITLGGNSFYMTPNGAGGIAYIPVIKEENMAEGEVIKVDLGPVNALAVDVRKQAEESVAILNGIIREKIYRDEPKIEKDEKQDRTMPVNVIESTAVNLKIALEALSLLINNVYSRLSRELSKL